MVGPHGEKRPGDTIANALKVAKIATGEAEEVYVDESKQPGGQKGRRARGRADTRAAPADRQGRRQGPIGLTRRRPMVGCGRYKKMGSGG